MTALCKHHTVHGFMHSKTGKIQIHMLHKERTGRFYMYYTTPSPIDTLCFKGVATNIANDSVLQHPKAARESNLHFPSEES